MFRVRTKARRYNLLRSRLIFLLIFVGGFAGCGRNTGTPPPVASNEISSDLMLAPIDGSRLQHSDLKRWRAEIRWAESPRYSDEEILSLGGVIFLRAPSGVVPQEVSKLEFVADMPQHGHGTGNNIPVVRATESDAGRWTFANVIFTMQGQWRIRVLATVDGQYDAWTTWVDVK